MHSKALFEKTYSLCQKWNLRQFSILEKGKDFKDELFELVHSILVRKSREEIGLEYGDVIFSLVRHAHGEKKRSLRKYVLFLVPGKKWLERKLEVFDTRHTWWMDMHGFHCIRNNKNPQKTKMILDRHKGLIAKNIWIR